MHTVFILLHPCLHQGATRKFGWLQTWHLGFTFSVFLLYEVPRHSLVTLFVLGSFHRFLWPKDVKLSIRCYLPHIAISLTVATLRAKLQRNGNPFPSSNFFPISPVSQIYIPLFSLQNHHTFCCCSESIAIVCREICHILYKLLPTYDRGLLSMTNFMAW